MSNDNKTSLSSEEQYIIDNWGAVWALHNFDWKTSDVIEALNEYAAQKSAPSVKLLQDKLLAEKQKSERLLEEINCAAVYLEKDGDRYHSSKLREAIAAYKNEGKEEQK